MDDGVMTRDWTLNRENMAESSSTAEILNPLFVLVPLNDKLQLMIIAVIAKISSLLI